MPYNRTEQNTWNLSLTWGTLPRCSLLTQEGCSVQLTALLPAFNWYPSEGKRCGVRTWALWHYHQHTAIQSNRWEPQALHQSTQGPCVPPQLSSTNNQKSPTSAYSGRAENPISNTNILLLKNLKRIWGGSEKPIPTGPNKFKPQSLNLLFPKAKSCFGLAGREPLTLAAKQSFTRSMLNVNQLHQTEVVFPIHFVLTFLSWKIVSKAFTNIYTLNVRALTFQRLIFFSSKGAGREEELSTDPFSSSEQVKTKPCWSSLRGYYSRPRKYFGLYLFKKKKKKVSEFQQVRDW